jgi:hypothetical protein
MLDDQVSDPTKVSILESIAFGFFDPWIEPEFRFPCGGLHVNVQSRLLLGEEEEPESPGS